MRSVQFTRIGEPTEVLELVDAPIPEPGPGEIRVRMSARPINPSDLLFVQGLYGRRPRLPSVVGFEGVGVLDACGPGVPLPRGIRVIVTSLGTWQEYVCVPGPSCIPVPHGLSDELAAQFVVNPLTAWILIEALELKPGEWLLQSAGASTLGQLVIQMARLRGIKTISTVRKDDQVGLLRALGADEVVQTEREDLRARVAELTQRRGAQGVLDAVGGVLGGQLVECMSRGGTTLVYGMLSGEPMSVNGGTLLFKGGNIKGFWLSDWMRLTPAAQRQRVVDGVMELLCQNRLKMDIAARYPLSAVKDAVAHAARSGRNGKILLET